MRRAIQTLIFFACIIFSVAAAYNVFSDNGEIEKLAAETACKEESAGCRAQKTMMERTPIAQTFEFSTTKRKVAVRCSRSLVLIGEYACALR